MKIDKIKQAIKINAKLVELGIDINSKDWESFNFKLDEWGNLIIKSGKLDHKPFVSCKSELTIESVRQIAESKGFNLHTEKNHYFNELGFSIKKDSKHIMWCNSLEEAKIYLDNLDSELTFENVQEFANDNGFELKEYKGFYKLYPLNSKFGTAKYIGFNTLKEVVNYLSELK